MHRKRIASFPAHRVSNARVCFNVTLFLLSETEIINSTSNTSHLFDLLVSLIVIFADRRTDTTAESSAASTRLKQVVQAFHSISDNLNLYSVSSTMRHFKRAMGMKESLLRNFYVTFTTDVARWDTQTELIRRVANPSLVCSMQFSNLKWNKREHFDDVVAMSTQQAWSHKILPIQHDITEEKLFSVPNSSPQYKMIIHLRYDINVTFQAVLSQMESMFNASSPPNRTSRLIQIAIFPTIVLIMAVHHLQTSSTTSKWIQSCSTILAGMVAVYLTLMVLVECTVRVILLKAGIQIGSTTTTSNPNHRCMLGRKNAALDRCIERSLVERKFEHETNAVRAANACSKSCCSICLEEFKPGDKVVSGRRDCCKSNVFHEACIKQWLKINDSCPCCRSPMLEQDEEREPCCNHKPQTANESANASSSSGIESSNARHIISEFRNRIDTATRLRNEILSYYLEFDRN